jgi:hypothetical protein
MLGYVTPPQPHLQGAAAGQAWKRVSIPAVIPYGRFNLTAGAGVLLSLTAFGGFLLTYITVFNVS